MASIDFSLLNNIVKKGTNAPELTKTCPKPIVIPIVFVPGMMGSKLRNRENKKLIWDDANGLLFWDWRGKNGAERRAKLVGEPNDNFHPSYLEVDFDTFQTYEGIGSDTEKRKQLKRGWGGVLWKSYGGFLQWLEKDLVRNLPDFSIDCTNIHFEVWAYPYNWTDSNENAALGLKKKGKYPKIKGLKDTVAIAFSETIKLYKEKKGIKVLKPIVITHSMGGLVARSYSVMGDGQDKVHAVMHGAMPTHGSPTAYKRMRAGFTEHGPYLGDNAPEVTAMVANSPGGLQLLPNQFHKDKDGNKQWLKITSEIEGDIRSLPTEDPYKEIYEENKDWWRLVNPAYINPIRENQTDVWLDYENNVYKAKDFHRRLGETGFHKPTNMFYCASEDIPSYDRVEWKAHNISKMSEKNKELAKQVLSKGALPLDDDNQGKLKFPLSISTYIDRSGKSVEVPLGSFLVEIQEPSSAGDGTVHIGSGKYIPTIVTSDATENGEEKVEYSHQDAFKNNAVRQQVAKWISEIIVEEAKG